MTTSVLYVLPGDGALAVVGDCAILLPGGTPGGRALTWCRSLVEKCESDPTTALIDQWDLVGSGAIDTAVCRIVNGSTEVVLTGAMRCVTDGDYIEETESFEFGNLGVASTDLWFPDGCRQVAVAPTGGGLGGRYSRMPVVGEVFVAAAAMAYVMLDVEASAPDELDLFGGDPMIVNGVVAAAIDQSLVVVFDNGSIRRVGASVAIFGGACEVSQRLGEVVLSNVSAASEQFEMSGEKHLVAVGSSIVVDVPTTILCGAESIRLGNLRDSDTLKPL